MKRTQITRPSVREILHSKQALRWPVNEKNPRTRLEAEGEITGRPVSSLDMTYLRHRPILETYVPCRSLTSDAKFLVMFAPSLGPSAVASPHVAR
jgi:hypothetical protein